MVLIVIRTVQEKSFSENRSYRTLTVYIYNEASDTDMRKIKNQCGKLVKSVAFMGHTVRQKLPLIEALLYFIIGNVTPCCQSKINGA